MTQALPRQGLAVIRINGVPLLDEKRKLSRQFRIPPRASGWRRTHYEGHSDRLQADAGSAAQPESAWALDLVESQLDGPPVHEQE